jgi:hypothetical protein
MMDLPRKFGLRLAVFALLVLVVVLLWATFG